MEFTFLSRVPAAPLDRFVESIWYARGRIPYQRELIAPTGSTVAAVILADPIRQTPAGGLTFLATSGFLIGPHDRPIVNEPTGETFCLGVVTTPVGCRAVFGVEPADLRGRVVDWPAAARLRAELTAARETFDHVPTDPGSSRPPPNPADHALSGSERLDPVGRAPGGPAPLRDRLHHAPVGRARDGSGPLPDPVGHAPGGSELLDPVGRAPGGREPLLGPIHHGPEPLAPLSRAPGGSGSLPDPVDHTLGASKLLDPDGRAGPEPLLDPRHHDVGDFSQVRREVASGPGHAERDLTGDPEAMLDHLERDLAESLVEVPGMDRCERAVAALETDPARSIASVADEVGVSHGHLDREFLRVVGLGPRALARILRVRRLLEHIDVYGQVAWTEHAAALGWFDQAHLIRDFKRHTGVTPSEYQAAQRREFGPEEAAPGFVPM